MYVVCVCVCVQKTNKNYVLNFDVDVCGLQVILK